MACYQISIHKHFKNALFVTWCLLGAWEVAVNVESKSSATVLEATLEFQLTQTLHKFLAISTGRDRSMYI